ncbi:hypothetical protein, partial [Phormidesmis sp. 146-33]
MSLPNDAIFETPDHPIALPPRPALTTRSNGSKHFNRFDLNFLVTFAGVNFDRGLAQMSIRIPSNG